MKKERVKKQVDSAIQAVSDYILVRKAKAGDKEAFGKLYKKYFDGLYRYVYFRLRNNHEVAEDIAEIALLKAWNKIDTYKKSAGEFRGWLFSIAHNAMVDYLRKKRKITKLEEYHKDENQSIEEKVIANDEKMIVMKSLSQLSNAQKEVIILRFIEELSYTEIAQIMNKKEDAIRALQSRGIRKLRIILK
ncbi:RNA polymerase sigma factor [Patescibacteria group bacterium]